MVRPRRRGDRRHRERLRRHGEGLRPPAAATIAAYADKAKRIAELARDPVEVVGAEWTRRSRRRSAMDSGSAAGRVPLAVHAAARDADPRARSRRSCSRSGFELHAGRRRAPVLRLRRARIRSCSRSCSRRVDGEQARRRSEAATAGCHRHREHRLPHAPCRAGTQRAGAALDRAARRADDRSRAARREAGEQPIASRSPARDARRYRHFLRDPDALDGQRCLRPRQQRHVLFVFRHRGQRAPDQRRRPRHPRRSGRGARRRDDVPLPASRCRFPRARCGPARRQARRHRRSPTRSASFGAATTTPAATAASFTSGSTGATQRPASDARRASARRSNRLLVVEPMSARASPPRSVTLRADERRHATAPRRRCSREFLRGDDHYRASSAVYGDGGRPSARASARSASWRVRRSASSGSRRRSRTKARAYRRRMRRLPRDLDVARHAGGRSSTT